MGTITMASEEYDAMVAERDRLMAENERLQMQLAACGVIALANTPESACEARKMHPDYMSASCHDVANAVDREMKLRTQLAEIEPALVAKNHEAHDLEIDNRQLRTQLAEARELLERCLGLGPLDWDLACKWCNERDNWLEANKA